MVADECPIQFGQFTHQDAERPLVADDVVQIVEKDISPHVRWIRRPQVRTVEVQQQSTEERSLLQVKGYCSVLLPQTPRLLLRPLVAAQIDALKDEVDRLMHLLARFSIDAEEGRPQRFVTPDDLAKSLLKNGDIQRPFEQQGSRHIVGRRLATQHLVDDPQSLLCVGHSKAVNGRFLLVEEPPVAQLLEGL